MAINLNKGEEEIPKSRFNLSKSSGPPPVDTEVDGFVGHEEHKQKKKRSVLLLVLAGVIILAAAIYFLTKGGETKDQPATNTELVTATDAGNDNILNTQGGETDANQPGNTVASADNPQSELPQPAAVNEEEVQTPPTNKTETANSANNKAQGTTTAVNNGVKSVVVPAISGSLPYERKKSYQVYQFPFGDFSYTLPNPELDNLADVLKQNPSVKISISAYTDNIGDVDFNLALSELRAKSIYDYLQSKGIETSRMSYKGKGISTRYNSKAENRRAEFVLTE